MFPVVFCSCAPTVESLINVLCGWIDVAERNEFSNVSAAYASTDGRYTDLSLMNNLCLSVSQAKRNLSYRLNQFVSVRDLMV